MTTPSPAPLSLSELKDQLDSLLVDYLSTLDHFQQQQHQLHSYLRDGYFHLARAKLALGPARLGQGAYDLAEKQSHRVVTVAPASSPSLPHSQPAADDKAGETDRLPLLSYTLSTRTPPSSSSASTHPDDDSTPSSSSQLRQRHPAPSLSSPAPPSSDSPPPTPSPSPPSALNQFSAFPPPALRFSASSFESVTDAVARVVELEGVLRERARGVKRARKAVERGERDARERERERGAGASQSSERGRGKR